MLRMKRGSIESFPTTAKTRATSQKTAGARAERDEKVEKASDRAAQEKSSTREN